MTNAYLDQTARIIAMERLLESKKIEFWKIKKISIF